MSKDFIHPCSDCRHWTAHYGPPENNGHHIGALGWKLLRCAVTGIACGPTVQNCRHFSEALTAS